MTEDSDDGPLLDGKYRVLGVLGEGGFGQVLHAVDEVLGEHQVAIKVLRDPGIDENMLVAEMQALAKLAHPGVVSFRHHFVQFRKLHLVMEYCPNGNLRKRLEHGPMAIDAAVQAALDVAGTMRFVHDHRIVHHDIKPENLLYAADGKLKVGDFGVANRNAGTRAYMAPELFLPAPVSSKDARVDVYALGVTLVELLVEDLPFWSKSAEELLRLKLKQEFVPNTLPEWLQEILFRATHPTPELRFQSMQDFAEALESRFVPYVFDRNRLRAQAIAEKAELFLVKKKWKKADTCIRQALAVSGDCVAAHMAAGRLALMLKRIPDASRHFGEALRINPRAHIQKDLGWIAVEQGDYAKAISLLNDHLLRNPTDFESYNLLLKCFYMTGRYEAGEDLARVVMGENPPSDSFRNNRFLCLLLSGTSARVLSEVNAEYILSPFMRYNYDVATESPVAWDTDHPVTLKSKLLFQEYRFGLSVASKLKNIVTIGLNGSETKLHSQLVSVGHLKANDVVLENPAASRRHFVLVNFPSDVWLVDLGSRNGTSVDGRPVEGRMHLDGVHTVRIERTEFSVSSREGALV